MIAFRLLLANLPDQYLLTSDAVMEVEVSLESGPVCLAGEEIRAKIVYSLPPTADHEVCLAWATAQLHCFCTVNQQRVALQGDGSVSRKSSNTSTAALQSSFQPTAGEAGVCVLATPAKILLCDLSLYPGQRQEYAYQETVPAAAPPSYRGAAIKYSYKLTVGTQRLGQRNVSLLRVPLRVLSVSDLAIPSTEGTAALETLGPSSPFLEAETTAGEGEVVSRSDLVMQAVQDITSRRRTSYFNIANTRGRVCKLCIFKTDYRLGEDIVASLDLTVGTLDCVQYSVSLCMAEKVSGDHKVKEDQQDKILSHSRHHEVSLGFDHSHFVLPVPLQLAPSFSTPVCSVSYYLHFEFVTTASRGEKQEVPQEEGGSEWQGPTKMEIETMVWDLPIKLYTTFPNHAAQSFRHEATVRGAA